MITVQYVPAHWVGMDGEPISIDIHNMDDVKRANAAAGYHFFDPDTMRSFSSRVGNTLYGDRYFVTSERSGFNYDSPRAWTVRAIRADGDIETIGEFCQYASGDAARRAARKLAGE